MKRKTKIINCCISYNDGEIGTITWEKFNFISLSLSKKEEKKFFKTQNNNKNNNFFFSFDEKFSFCFYIQC